MTVVPGTMWRRARTSQPSVALVLSDKVALVTVLAGLMLMMAPVGLQLFALVSLGGAFVAWWLSGLLLSRLPGCHR